MGKERHVSKIVDDRKRERALKTERERNGHAVIQELSVDLVLFISGLTSNHSLLISLARRHESLILSSLHPFLRIFFSRIPLFHPFVSGRIHQIDWKYWRCVAGSRRSPESMETLSDSSSSGRQMHSTDAQRLVAKATAVCL